MRASILACVLVLAACARPPDPLELFRATCRGLQEKKELKEGLSIEQCAKDLKAASDADDPVRRAEELLTRLEALVQKGKAGQSTTHQQELRDAVLSLQLLGRFAVPQLKAKLEASPDADLRIAVARALVGICSTECAQERYDCIVPALLEGTGDDKPPEVRQESLRGLARCTGKGFGGDLKAWRDWYAALPPPAAKK